MRAPHGTSAGSESRGPPRSLIPCATASIFWVVVTCSEKPSPFSRSLPSAPSSLLIERRASPARSRYDGSGSILSVVTAGNRQIPRVWPLVSAAWLGPAILAAFQAYVQARLAHEPP